MQGIVVKSTGSWYEVRQEDGTHISCRIRGKLKLDELKATNPIAVGDKVVYELENSSNNQGIISDLLPRANYIIRQSPRNKNERHILAANIDQAILIASISLPRTSLGFIDRFLLVAELYHIPTIIVFNKTDLQEGKNQIKQKEAVELYQSLSYKVIEASITNQVNVEQLKDLTKDKFTLVCGHSGSGKTTLINYLIPNLNLKTQEISKKFEKGLHTTTHTESYQLPYGGSIIDSPGIKELGMTNLKVNEISNGFVEMRAVSNNCKFNDCLHINEPECAVKAAAQNQQIAISRYESYLNIVEELQRKKPY